jgi:hypothetical protein
MTERFTYYALYPRDYRKDRPVGLLAEGCLEPDQPLRVAGWDHIEQTWNEAGASLGEITVNPDYDERFRIVDRATAERIARENLGAELPSEEELYRIADEEIQQRRRRWAQRTPRGRGGCGSVNASVRVGGQ